MAQKVTRIVTIGPDKIMATIVAHNHEKAIAVAETTDKQLLILASGEVLRKRGGKFESVGQLDETSLARLLPITGSGRKKVY